MNGRKEEEDVEAGEHTHKPLLNMYEDWFEARPLIYPPNHYNMVEWEKGKIKRWN
jgi:hypothetical protein